jgi:hypothetical protein
MHGEYLTKIRIVLLVALVMALAIPAAAQGKADNKVYFAAPLFNQSEQDYNLKITNILESYGYEVFLPQRDGYLAAELVGMTQEEAMDKIFHYKDYKSW